MMFLGFLLCGLAAAAFSRELPDYILLCRRTDPDFNGCIKRATVAIQPHLAKGIKELNIPPMEPLVVPMVKLEQGTGAVNYKVTLTNLKIYGLSNYRFHEVMADFFQTRTLHAVVDLPKITLIADYSIGGNVLIVPIKGNGEMTANITNCKSDVNFQGAFIEKKNQQYFQAVDVKNKLHIGDATIHFGNLFSGDSVLGMTTNKFLNENSNDILNEIKPAVEAVTDMLLADLINKIFRTLPADKFFPQ